ncbi:hypothetical protein HOLleu_35597 [Holothuria leucospilota]|uniref:Uncharacterized protein n=1 Tax=Holothuria leucospilota TaxID=206669 RepID=A0A9Q1BE34_HOLLE|nr:hypothetical protein HOLleu_35597 [Holothuria leucospilota]
MFTAEKWMLAFDCHIVADNISSFQSALGMLFSVYYCFGTEYQKRAPATLDFLQRCFLTVKPEKGSKLKTRCGTHSKVLSLTKSISDFEWEL